MKDGSCLVKTRIYYLLCLLHCCKIGTNQHSNWVQREMTTAASNWRSRKRSWNNSLQCAKSKSLSCSSRSTRSHIPRWWPRSPLALWLCECWDRGNVIVYRAQKAIQGEDCLPRRRSWLRSPLAHTGVHAAHTSVNVGLCVANEVLNTSWLNLLCDYYVIIMWLLCDYYAIIMWLFISFRI